MINFQSIISKQANFSLFLNDNHPDIIFGTETWLSSEIKSSEIIPNIYNIVRHDRSDGYGGVLIGIRSDLSVTECSTETDSDLVICKIILPNKEPILLCAVYRPPNSNLVYLENVITTLTNIVRNNPQSPIWIAGDFNFPIINWSDGSISGNNYPHTFAELLLDFSNTYGFTQIVDAPTRKHNILDLFLTNRPSLVKSCKVIPGFSDHEIVHISTYVSAPCKLNSRKVFLCIRLTLI